MPTFFDQRKSLPSAYQANAGAALIAAGESLANALQQFKKTADVTASWTGSASKQHEDRVAKLADAASRVIQAIAYASTVTKAGSTQMQVLKTANDATVASAVSGQFLVLPSGQVVPGPAHYAQATGPHGPALMKLFWTIAKLYTGQINANVASSTATDAQVAATLAAVAIKYFADLLSDKDKNAAIPPAVTPGTVTPGLGSTTVPISHTTPQDIPGTQLAGAGSLGAAGRLSGAGGLGGVSALGGAAGRGMGGIGMDVGSPMATGLMGMAGTNAVSATGAASGGAAGRGMTGGASMMPMGAGAGAAGHGQDGKDAQSETWLQEDRDPFHPDDDPPDAVLA
jgi:uncharacterized protein YukE